MKLTKPSNPQVEITVSNRTVVRVLLLVVATMLGLAALKQAAHALTLIFIAFFLALALNPPVHWLAQRLPQPCHWVIAPYLCRHTWWVFGQYCATHHQTDGYVCELRSAPRP
jgi:hypothetical protein